MRKIITLLVFILALTGCSVVPSIGSVNLMSGIKARSIVPIKIDGTEEKSEAPEITNFSLDIFRKNYGSENMLISPLSIISALSMTANGAEKETLSQMEEVFGTDLTDLNQYLYAYRSYLPTGEKYKMSLANSIWFKDAEDLTVEQDFLQMNKDYYDADVYKALFDESTKDDINTWVHEKTNGQIEKLLDESIPKEAVMYLINALSFDAQWRDIYEDIAVHKGEFTSASGDKKTVDFMHSTEHGYIQTPGAVGFSKPYADEKYYFIALLPNEGFDVSRLLDLIDGETLVDVLKNQSNEAVQVSIPKFEFEYADELSDVLKELGMKDAFDRKLADFSSLGRSTDGNIFINRVIHKTKIRVDEKGTEAGAVTGVEMIKESAIPLERKTVKLDRPFFFMIVDGEYGLPIFMGTLNDIES